MNALKSSTVKPRPPAPWYWMIVVGYGIFGVSVLLFCLQVVQSEKLRDPLDARANAFMGVSQTVSSLMLERSQQSLLAGQLSTQLRQELPAADQAEAEQQLAAAKAEVARLDAELAPLQSAYTGISNQVYAEKVKYFSAKTASNHRAILLVMALLVGLSLREIGRFWRFRDRRAFLLNSQMA